jgi:alpha-ketoglutarate-dependent taurine dioxygenase
VVARERLESLGVVLIRGFRVDAPGFVAFQRRLLSRFKATPVHRGTHPLHRMIQTVTPGTQAMGFHAEYAHLPDAPDVISFWCEVPGGETMVCHGALLWGALSQATQQLFLTHRISYTAWHDRPVWVAAAGTDNITELRRRAEPIRDYHVEEGPGGGLITKFTTHALFRRHPDQEMGLAANLFANAYATLWVTWEGGDPISARVLQEVSRAADAACWQMVWAPGDVLVLDNRRVLHARATQVLHRKAWAVLGYY